MQWYIENKKVVDARFRGAMRGFCFSSFPFIFYLYTFILSLLFLSCAQPTDSPDEGVRERISVSGPISEEAVWCCILGNL